MQHERNSTMNCSIVGWAVLWFRRRGGGGLGLAVFWSTVLVVKLESRESRQTNTTSRERE
jgi:hypothetical protein